MSYLSLARKWRPQIFSDLIGQEHIAQTLTNAIKIGRLSQGYLFTGTRGIGKTSAARILAKALRCQNPKEIGVPCGKCKDCIEIAEGRSVDVLEIDGASNNGVDSVREIRENAKYLPNSGRYKIYIIDEVHMLTTAAFNALLKTLEEPPPHVVFIFATTDPQKIPETVLSRCQRFDFKRVPLKDLQARIEYICEQEKIKITPDALMVLAREAEGSMRDALSLLDQVLSVAIEEKFQDSKTDSPSTIGTIGLNELVKALGLIDKQTILECVEAVLKHDSIKAIEAVGRVYLHGFDLKQFGRELLRFIRTIMVAKLLYQNKVQVSQYLEISDVDLKDIQSLIELRSIQELDSLFRILNQGLEEVAKSSIPKIVMDVLLIKMATFGLENKNLAPQNKIPVNQTAQSEPKVQNTEKKTVEPVKQNLNKKTLTIEEWKECVDFIKNQKPLFASSLELLGFLGANVNNDGVLQINLSYTKKTELFKDQLSVAANRDLLIHILQNYLSTLIKIEFVKIDDENISKDTAQAGQVKVKTVDELRTEEKKKFLESNEIIKATQDLFGARLESFEVLDLEEKNNKKE